MCGRFVNVSKLEAVEKRFRVKAITAHDYQINPNVGVGQKASVITAEEPAVLQAMLFGLTPFWSKKTMYLFNARVEGDHNKENDPHYHGQKGIAQKPAFRHLFKSRRCLVPADAFIEGPEKEKLDRPYLVFRKHQDRPFAFAGLWDKWTHPDNGTEINGFTIITTIATPLLQQIGHHRSPVVLTREHEQLWLDQSLSTAELLSLLQPLHDQDWNAYPISKEIKKPSARDLSLLQPIGEPLRIEVDYQVTENLQLFGMGFTQARSRKEKE